MDTVTTSSFKYTQLCTKIFKISALSLALALSACGGGDGTGGVDAIKPGGGGGTDTGGGGGGGTDTGGGGGSPVAEGIGISEAKLLGADGNDIASLGLEGGYYQIKVVNKDKQPLANAKVSFAVDASGVDLTQSTSGSVLTDSDGIARVFLKPTAPDVSGAYTVTATAIHNGKTVAKGLDFSVQATNVQLGNITMDRNQLPSGGQTSLSLKVTGASGNALSGVLINFNASCGQIPAQATSDSEGMVEVVYKAINADGSLCSGNIRLSANAGNQTQSANVSVQAPEATSIIYTSSALTLGIQNSGSSATGQVDFTVYSDKSPLANTEVTLSLEKSPLGLSFGTLGNRDDFTAKTDQDGKVSVNIYPGSTPGPVEIKATLVKDNRINALSKGISIASSRATQDGLSISWGKNVLDWSFDGDSTTIAARLVDRNGNTVPDGTVISFTAEGGKVSPSSCTTSNGECQVNFSTQNPRPGDGRVSVLAVAEGEKAYIDMNENNAWDEGVDVLVHNIGDTFRDDNENGTFEKGEFTYPLTTGASGTCEDNVRKFVDLKFPTLKELQKQAWRDNFIGKFVSPNKPATCNTGLDAVVRYQSVTLLSEGSIFPRLVLLDDAGMILQPQAVNAKDGIAFVRMNSGGIFYNLNPMPSGTKINFTVKDMTTFKPYAEIDADKKVINVYGLSKLMNATVKIGEKEFNVPVSSIRADRTAKVSITGDMPEGKVEVNQEQLTCEFGAAGGHKELPAIQPVGKPGDNMGTIHSASYLKCEAGDLLKMTINTPKGQEYTISYVMQ